jgi:solute carrier family 30 (zinc transporter), member 1
LVLGGHGHSHSPEEHDHDHGDEMNAAEEGHSHRAHAHVHEAERDPEESDGNIGDVFPEAVIAKVKSRSTQHIRFSGSREDGSPSKDSPRSLSRSMSKTSRKHRRRTSSRNNRFTNIDDISIHPASFRQDIIAASKPQLDGIDSGDNTASEEETAVADEDTPTENFPLLGSNGKTHGHGTTNGHDHEHGDQEDHIHKPRHDSWHISHNHNKPKKASKGGHGHNHADMGMNAMILHVIGDALGNVGVIVSALVIWLTNWSGRYYADPAVSLFITLIILKSTIPLTFATAKILLQATPDHIDVNDIKEDIQELPGVISCHHIHIWQLSDTQIVASMHIQVEFPINEAGGEKYMELAKAARKCLHAYGIHSATIQPEFCLDKDHDHSSETSGQMGLDGIVGQPRCRLDDDCLLECVDNCMGKGCCSPPKSADDHSDHDHGDEGHSY